MLALFAVFVYGTHATQSVALRALRALRLAGNRALDVDDDDAARPQAGECTRKEYRHFTALEIRAFHNALNDMKRSGQYRIFDQHHGPRESPAAHFGPAFFCWHRVYLSLYVCASLK